MPGIVLGADYFMAIKKSIDRNYMFIDLTNS